MLALIQAGPEVPAPVPYLLQFAAIVLETGGALLIVAIFGVASRVSHRRDYFTTWTIASRALVVALAAIGLGYYLINGASFGATVKGALALHALNWLYVTGKLAYWTFVWRGAMEYARPADVTGKRWHWIAGAAALGAVSEALARDVNDLVMIQVPVAVAACALAAIALLRLPGPRRTAGGVTIGVVLAATALLWLAYGVAFGNSIGLIGLSAGPLQEVLLAYNSYADMLMLVTLGFAMLMLFMEDARLRIANIEERLGSLVMASSDPIITLDDRRRIAVANRAAQRLFGAGSRLAAGAAVELLVAPADRARLTAAIDDFRASDDAARPVVADDFVTGLGATGDAFAAEITLSRLFDADVTAVSLVVRDVTERLETEQRHRQVTTMEAVRQLAGGLAHDFNNLLTTIVGRTQIVARTLGKASTVREDVHEIEQAAAAAARLSRDLLALSRREPLDPERLSLDEVVRRCHARIGESQPGAGTVELRLGSANAHAHVDRRRLEGALFAIVQNAIDASGASAHAIVVETSRAILPPRSGAATEVACIAVRDRGPGLTDEARAHLFEPFFSTKGDGRGLGLATTWAFVHQSGGSVDVDSGPQGTTVRMLFPLAVAPVAEPGAGPAHAPLAIVPPTRRAPQQVLLAEDEPSVRKSVRVFLERAGFIVVEASDGVEALAAFERTPDEFGLLLTDVMMPQMGGRELTARVLALRPEMRVVFMSGFLRDPEVLRMVNDRRVRYVAKPFDLDTLVGIVRAELDADGAHVA